MSKKQSTANPRSLEWARQIVSFAVGNDETRVYLQSAQIEAKRVVACDGSRLAWQEYESATPCQALVPDFPNYEAVIPRDAPQVTFPMILGKDWLAALKKISKLARRPFGYIICDGLHLRACLETDCPAVQASITLPIDSPEVARLNVTFKIGIRLDYLYEALNAADLGGIVTMAIRDENTAIEIRNDGGFFSITMPCRTNGAFMTVQEDQEQQAA